MPILPAYPVSKLRSSQGAFLAYLRIVAEQLGYSASFELFPTGSYDETDPKTTMSRQPVARVTLAKDSSVTTTDSSLFRSDTNRAPYTVAPLTAAQTEALSALAANSAASLTILRDEQSKNEARSGFAMGGQGTTGFKKYLLQGLITVFPALNDDVAAAKNAIAMTEAGVDNTAARGLISTLGNTRTEQVLLPMRHSMRNTRPRGRRSSCSSASAPPRPSTRSR